MTCTRCRPRTGSGGPSRRSCPSSARTRATRSSPAWTRRASSTCAWSAAATAASPPRERPGGHRAGRGRRGAGGSRRRHRGGHRSPGTAAAADHPAPDGGPGGPVTAGPEGHRRAGATGPAAIRQAAGGSPARAPAGPAAGHPGGPGRAGRARGRESGPEGAERCEMCREVLSERHGHVVDLEKRSLACTCRACYLLFTHEGAAGRPVPGRARARLPRPGPRRSPTRTGTSCRSRWPWRSSSTTRRWSAWWRATRAPAARPSASSTWPPGTGWPRPTRCWRAGPRRRGHLREPHRAR